MSNTKNTKSRPDDTHYTPRTPKGTTPAQAVAHHNSAAMALLAAIEEQLRPAHGSNWADAGDAQHVASELLKLYATMTGRESGDCFTLATDGGRGRPMRFDVVDV